MNKTLKSLRSIFTSFLFICLVFLLTLSIFMTFLRKGKGNLSDRIDREHILNSVVLDYDEKDKDIYFQYIDQFIKFVFHKRSYPTIDYQKYDNLENTNQIYSNLELLKTNLELEYKTVVMIRNIYSFIENNSVYMLIYFIILIIILILSILYLSFLRGIKITSYSLVSSSFISFLLAFYIRTKFEHNDILNYYKHIFLGKNGNYFFIIISIYLLIGIMPLIANYIYEKRCKN